MPSKQAHLVQAQHNERFASALNADKSYAHCLDWVVTVYFYSALHYVEAYLATLAPEIHSPDHRARDDVLVRNPTLFKIWAEYSDLKNDSINARYQMYQMSPSEISASVQPNHATIKKYLLGKIPP